MMMESILIAGGSDRLPGMRLSIVNRRHLYQALLDPGRVGKIDENRAFTVTPSVSSKSYSTRRRGIVGEISDRIFAVLQRGAKRAA